MTRARKRLLNNDNIDSFNSRITTSILINNIDKNIIIVQRNAIKYIINKLLIKCFTQAHKQDIIFFSNKHSQIRKKGSQIVENRELLAIQDRKSHCIRPRLLYYCRKMPACLLSNVCIKLEIVNSI